MGSPLEWIRGYLYFSRQASVLVCGIMLVVGIPIILCIAALVILLSR